MKKLEMIIELYPDEEFLRADGFDEAVIGVDEDGMRLVYSVQKCLEILLAEMDFDDAWEHLM